MTAALVSLPAARARKPAPALTKTADRVRSRAFKRRMRRQAMAAVGIGTVATVLTALSLSHLAHGIVIVTGAAIWEAWAFAIGIDVAMIVAELAMLFAATPSVRKQIGVYGKPFIVGTLISSAILNSFAFAAHTTGWMTAPAVVFGVAVPAMIYALTRIGAALFLDCNR